MSHLVRVKDKDVSDFGSSFGRTHGIELHIGAMTKCPSLVVKDWIGSLYPCLNNNRLISMSGAFILIENQALNMPMRHGHPVQQSNKSDFCCLLLRMELSWS